MSLIHTALMLKSAGKPITPGNLRAVLSATGVRTDHGEIDAFLSLLGQQHSVTREGDGTCQSSSSLESSGASESDCLAPYIYSVATGEPAHFKTAGMTGAAVSRLAERGLVAMVHEQTAAPCPPPEEGSRDTLRQKADRVRTREECGVQVTVSVSVGRPERAEGCMGAMAGFACLIEKGRAEALRAIFHCHCPENGLAARAAGAWPSYG